jgi:hypothetical protein
MKGHPILGVIAGFFFGDFLALLLLGMGVLATDSILLIVLPLAGLVLGLALAAAAPFRRSRLQPAGADTTPTFGGAAAGDPPTGGDPLE